MSDPSLSDPSLSASDPDPLPGIEEERPPDRLSRFRSGALRRKWDLLAGLAILVVFFPQYIFPAQAGLDPSWQLGLSWAHELNLQYGPELDFTYGPLGFVSRVVPLSVGLLLIGFSVNLFFSVTVLVSIRWLTSRLGFWVSWLFSALGLFLAGLAPMNLASVCFVLVGLAIMLMPRKPMRDQWLLALLGVYAGTALLTKFNTGLYAVIALPLAAIVIARTTRGFVAAGAGLFGGTLFWWLAMGQNPVHLGSWFWYSLNIALGYGEAMELSPTKVSTAAILVAVVLALVVAGLAVALAWRTQKKWLARISMSLFLLLYLAMALASGTTRIAAGHMIQSLVLPQTVLGLVLAGALIWDVGSRRLIAAVVAPIAALVLGLAMVCAAALGKAQQFIPNLDSIETLATAARYTFKPAALQAELDNAAARIRAKYQIPDPVIAALRERQVQAEPWDISAVWAYRLGWKPVPVFQTYSAYTTTLDQLNATALARPAGPDAILRRSPEAIDGKQQVWESPYYQLRMICRFSESAAGGAWQALIRNDDRCGPARQISSITAAAGQTIEVPTVSPGEMLTASIVAPRPFSARIISLVTLGSKPLRVRCNSSWYRIGQGSPTGPLLTDFPDDIGWTPTAIPTRCKTLEVNREAKIEFQALPLDPG